ncbi:hypothetical protein AGF18_13210 [Klebsiella oxytoca]|jgi:hypothetical protein|uniref:hypothetical protein n=1 Tax=Klebsiella oxytoca TaxID=571 RepID=UPI000373307B|nr:hypothetical protein [Klebsiella oxytoca]APB44822.1 hypothetical protein AGF18_13210 [Klebsiella oxytoca]AVL83707.1 hypothetical protein CEQ13_27600 [Klebsiella oxytoca]OFN66930.1 hypothetical protein HMPREF2540_04290 [Enterobacter sp. HMSC055A11]HBM2923623.1 hypothetical protein [Klebsiella oxytoca]
MMQPENCKRQDAQFFMNFSSIVTQIAKPGALMRWSLLLALHEFRVCQKNYFDFSGAVTE